MKLLNRVSKRGVVASLVMAGLALGGIAQPVAAQDEWTQQVRRILQSVGSTYESNGYTMTHNIYTGSLDEGENDYVTLTLNIGTDYQIMGVCDTDCSDVDLVLYGPNGNEIDRDVLTDDAPIVSVTPPRTGTYRIKVIMVDCRVEPCRYGLGAFGR